MKKLFIIDNSFFNKLPDINFLIENFKMSLNNQSVQNMVQDGEIIFIDNGNEQFNEKIKHEKIKIISSISDINFDNYTLVCYSNVPFFSISNVLDNIIESKDLPTNTIITQEAYNLIPLSETLQKRFLFSKTKPSKYGNISSIGLYLFKPELIDGEYPRFNTQKDLVRFLHNKNPYVLLEFFNILGTTSFQLFDTEEEYVDYCLGENKSTNGSIGNYAIYFPSEITTEKMKEIILDLQHKNPKMIIDLRTQQNIDDIFGENIVEVDGEFKVVNNFSGDNSRIVISNSNLLHYDFNTIDGVIDLSDSHFKYLLLGGTKYMKVYNDEYKFFYQINKQDILNSKTIAIKRTMGMGDALLTLPIVKMIKELNPDIYLYFYSAYDFRPYMINGNSLIDEYVKIDSNKLFADITEPYDIILDFDLCYENQTNGGRFFDYYMSFFEDGTFDNITSEPILLSTVPPTDKKSCILVGEGSGWGGKEPNMDVIETIAYTLKQKGYYVQESGINRISNYADETNPEKSFNKLFDMVSRAKFYIGTDSGVSHIANLMGKPSFVIGGSADPTKTQYNPNLVYPFGKTDLLCYGCRHHFKGFRTLQDGTNTFIPICHNVKQYQCMKELDINLLIEDLDNFLIKFDL